MAATTLEQYQEVEQRTAHDQGRQGFRIHALVTIILAAVLIAINATVADEFPWAVFPVVGMSIGLWFHWYFGVARAEELMRRHQDEIKHRAAQR